MRQIDFNKLEELRHLFLEDRQHAAAAYWDNTQTLTLYDATFARRIAWKWDAVWNELAELSWSLPATVDGIIDWGCGSGVASETLLTHFPSTQSLPFFVYDHSAVATSFTTQKLAKNFEVTQITQSIPHQNLSSKALLVSHVLTELDTKSLSILTELARNCGTVIWVEPGTAACSKKLITVRESLVPEKEIVAPCLHQSSCRLEKNPLAKDWCHFFAKPPQSIFHDPNWARFAKTLKIDLRSLPVSYLVAEKSTLKRPAPLEEARMLGRPRLQKGCAHVCVCRQEKVATEIIQKKTNKDVFALLENGDFRTIF